MLKKILPIKSSSKKQLGSGAAVQSWLMLQCYIRKSLLIAHALTDLKRGAECISIKAEKKADKIQHLFMQKKKCAPDVCLHKT